MSDDLTPVQAAVVPDGYVINLWQRGFGRTVGPFYSKRDEANNEIMAFRVEEHHANGMNNCHGGMLMSFADRALGETAMRAAEGANCVTIQLEMKFIDVGRLGDWIEIRPQVVKRTGSLVFMRGDVRDGTRLLASADGVWKILRRRPS